MYSWQGAIVAEMPLGIDGFLLYATTHMAAPIPLTVAMELHTITNLQIGACLSSKSCNRHWIVHEVSSVCFERISLCHMSVYVRTYICKYYCISWWKPTYIRTYVAKITCTSECSYVPWICSICYHWPFQFVSPMSPYLFVVSHCAKLITWHNQPIINFEPILLQLLAGGVKW